MPIVSSMVFRTIFASVISILLISPSMAREQIRIVGSSTVYPFIASAAEQFGQGDFKTPIVESTGTGGGFKLFCDGLGDDKPDISNASRPIKDSEQVKCKENGVDDVMEVPIGYDGIVLANKRGGMAVDLSKKHIFMALARELPDANGKMRTNPYVKWNEIDSGLPDQTIEVYGPPPTSGTRDAFVELVMEEGCEHFPAFVTYYPNKKERHKVCHLLREDGRYIDSGEDDNIIVQKLVSNDNAFGILGYGFYVENSAKIQSNKIAGVLPNYETIASNAYGVSRSLFIYVKTQHIATVPGIKEFLKEVVSEHAAGPEGYMTAKGLLPLSKDLRKSTRAKVKALSRP